MRSNIADWNSKTKDLFDSKELKELKIVNETRQFDWLNDWPKRHETSGNLPKAAHLGQLT